MTTSGNCCLPQICGHFYLDENKVWFYIRVTRPGASVAVNPLITAWYPLAWWLILDCGCMIAMLMKSTMLLPHRKLVPRAACRVGARSNLRVFFSGRHFHTYITGCKQTRIRNNINNAICHRNGAFRCFFIIIPMFLFLPPSSSTNVLSSIFTGTINFNFSFLKWVKKY